MQNNIFVRMGDGQRVLMSSDQVKEDLLAGTQDAAQRAEIPPLTSDELEQLFDIFSDPSRIVSVLPGEEVIVTDDAVCTLFYLDQDNSGQGIPMSRVQSVLAYERACAADTVSILWQQVWEASGRPEIWWPGCK
jgi:dimethylamine--corrinoid protein Co-methyltransferase